MTTRLTIDADLVAEDLRRDPIEVEISNLGVFTFPGVPPASAAIRLARWAEDGTTDVSGMQAVALLGDFVPDEILTQWRQLGFDILNPRHHETVALVLKSLVAEYQRRQSMIDSASPGKSMAATMPQPPPYSDTGASSSPTTAASTPSTFPVI